MTRTALAILAATALLVGAAAPGALALADEDLDVGVEQADDGTAAVTVTANGTAAENATVNVSVGENATYAGTGSYETDANGTVSLPAPNETVTVSVTATFENATANATVELLDAEDRASEDDAAGTSFGERVAAFVHALRNDSNASQPFGLLVAQFVVAENPGNGQGPPAWAGPGGDDGEPGPPEHANMSDGDEPGPPERAGGHGPPEHADAGGDDGSEEATTESEETTTAS